MPQYLSLLLTTPHFQWASHICVPLGDMDVRCQCVTAACSFIALAAWMRQLPFWLLNCRVVTEYLQSGHLNLLKPFIIVMV